jgi:hypothetical protein
VAAVTVVPYLLVLALAVAATGPRLLPLTRGWPLPELPGLRILRAHVLEDQFAFLRLKRQWEKGRCRAQLRMSRATERERGRSE